MKKILYLIPTFSNLSETFILREVLELDKRKNLSVHVVSLKEGKAILPSDFLPKVTYIKIAFPDVLSSISYFFQNFNHILKIFIEFFKLSEDYFFKKIFLFLKALIYAQKLNYFSYNQMHIHFLSEFSTIFSLVSLIHQKPFSISGHARDILVDASSINFKVKKSSFITLCNTKAFLKCLELSGGKGRKNVFLSFHGIDLSDYKFTKREILNYNLLNFHKNEINVLTDARFTEKKGLKTLSQAIIKLIKESNYNIKLTIIGIAANESQINHMNEIIEIFKNSKLRSHLYIPGEGSGIQQKEVINLYEKSDIFMFAGINTSNGDSDGVPNGLIQAAFSGLPIITTDSGSIKDLFNETNCYISNQNDFNDLFDKFNNFVLDPHKTQKVNKAYLDVKENFDLNKNIQYFKDPFSNEKNCYSC